MYCFVMQPWQVIRGQSIVTTVTQTEANWLDLTSYQDVVAWLDCKEFNAGGGTNVQMAYQTAPTKDDSLFLPIVSPFNVALGVTTTVMLKDVVTNTLTRWLRWQLTVTGSPSSVWDATFRIFIAANVVGKGRTAAAVAASTPPGTPPSVPLHAQPTGTPPNQPGSFVAGIRGTSVPAQQPTATLNKATLVQSASVFTPGQGTAVQFQPKQVQFQPQQTIGQLPPNNPFKGR